eukprot:9504099-Pyramimonas_sp.AAC.1
MDEHMASAPVSCSRYAAFISLAPPAPPPGCEEEQTAQILHPLICTAMGGTPGDIQETVGLLRKDTENTYGIMAPCNMTAVDVRKLSACLSPKHRLTSAWLRVS